MSRVIFDASSLMISIKEETGFEVIDAIDADVIMSSVNYAEIVTQLALGRASPETIEGILAEYPVTVYPFTESLAKVTGLIAARTRHLGLSLGDRACLALAMELKLPVFTADRAWSELDLDLDIRQVR